MLGTAWDQESTKAKVKCLVLAPVGMVGRCTSHFVKLRQGSGKDRQGMAVKAKGLKA